MILDHAATLPDNLLKSKGLTNNELHDIKTGNYQVISDAGVQAASLKLAFNIASCTKAGISCNYSVYWHWDVEPILKYQDAIAATISHGYWMTGNVTGKIGYRVLGTTNSTMIYRHSPTYTSGPSCRFDMQMARGNVWCQSRKAFVATLGNDSPSGALITHAEYCLQANSSSADFAVSTNTPVIGVGITWVNKYGTIEGESTVHLN